METTQAALSGPAESPRAAARDLEVNRAPPAEQAGAAALPVPAEAGAVVSPVPAEGGAVDSPETEWAGPEAAVPVTTIVSGEFVALLEIFTVPLCAVAVFGSKVTSNVALCPAASVAPLTPPLVVKAVLEVLIPDTVTPEFPVFFKITGNR